MRNMITTLVFIQSVQSAKKGFFWKIANVFSRMSSSWIIVKEERFFAKDNSS
jgi:hypothetical protein